MKKIIELCNVYKSVADGESHLTILKDCSVAVNEGDMIAILGRSGSGKTTLLNIIAMLDLDFSGEYFFQGKGIKNMTRKEIFDLRSRSIGYIFQDFQLIDDFSVLQNVEMPLGYQNISKKKRTKISIEAIKHVGLLGRENSIVGNLSGGERQRVSIARAIAQNPKIIVADEPTGSLDVKTSQEIIELLVRLNRNNDMTILLVTHDMEVASQCKSQFILSGGVLRHEEENIII